MTSKPWWSVVNFNCCTARSEFDQDCSPISAVASLDQLGFFREDLDTEWEIIRNSIGSSEFEGVQKLRKAVQDCDEHPACASQPLSKQPQTLLRFLRAREGHLGKAEKMFRDMLDWRIEFQVEAKVAQWRDELERQSTQRAVLCKRYSSDIELCEDRYGIPLRLIRLSVCDAAGAAREFGKEAVLVDTLVKLEHTHQEIRRAMFRHEKLIRGQVQVIDVGDYGIHGVPQWAARMWASFQHGPELYKVLDGNYPETVRTVIFIRTGPVTKNIWRMVLPLVPPRTKKKLKLYGQRAQEWSEDLLKELPRNPDVPKFLLCDSNEAFAEAYPKGGIIPDGAAGVDFGQWEVHKPPPNVWQAARVEKSKVQAPRSFWSFLMILVALLFAASLGSSVAWPLESAAPG